MVFWPYIAGCVTVSITAADTMGLINNLNKEGIPLSNIAFVDELTIQITFTRGGFSRAETIFKKYGFAYKIITISGLYWKLKEVLRRPVFLIGMFLIILLTVYVPSRVMFINVTGNSSVATELILEKAENCGIYFGSSRKAVRSEKVKNLLIEQLPQLQWVGVNTSGCVVTIQVSERTMDQDFSETERVVSSIVASRDGVILACTVMRGTPLCKTGQAVTEGQKLVSGYTDCGICVQATTAKAEVLAQTTRELSVISPMFAQRRVQSVDMNRKYSVRIGKNIIKLWKDSGIHDTTCVKIYDEKKLVLPGGFVLPVSLVIESFQYYETDITLTEDTQWLNDFADDYIQQQMVAGQIVDKNEQLTAEDGIVQLTTRYGCTEMIGQTKCEEITLNYGYD